ncbi:DUF4239 domain-containing protein [Azotobacter chroococcum]|uniref:DUF4239 domain-containing protein n=1 Tax=Azotobacter chroococcum NCIMB 8003 TaxID=1328314 RepID=A0A0C4WJC6_9GAMM|nr:DUF4239 domain-containing protein [Azotobacter chroococcum]AJE20019.1 Hypothetical protein Achr_5140 [Azotobacter chroococcum NCIMB 8003]
MGFETISIGSLFAITAVLVVIAIEAGYWAGHAVHRHRENEKESAVSTIVSANMALLAFVLAFTFAIVSNLYEARKTLVREDANAIRTAFLRADFLPEADRGKVAELFAEYVDLRVRMAQGPSPESIRQGLIRSERIHRQLWEMAIAHARTGTNPPIPNLYIPALNEMIRVYALRVDIALETRLPRNIWLVQYTLLVLAMAGFGYQMANAGSRRSWATPCLALSFAVVIALIASLDRPMSGYFTAPQQPMADLQAEIAAAMQSRQRHQDGPGLE